MSDYEKIWNIYSKLKKYKYEITKEHIDDLLGYGTNIDNEMLALCGLVCLNKYEVTWYTIKQKINGTTHIIKKCW